MSELQQVDVVEQTAKLAPALAALAAASDVEGVFPTAAMGLLHTAGLATAALPAHDGGLGLNEAASRLSLLNVLKHVGRGDLAVGRLYEGHVNALQLVYDFGTRPQQQAAALAAAQGLWSGVWNTQGPDGLRMVALGNGWRLSGCKTFASGAGHLARPVVTAQRPDGTWQMLVLDTALMPPSVDPSFWQPLGMRATASFKVCFDDVRVDADAMLGAPGDYTREPGFTAGSVRFAAVQLGGAEAVLDETRRFLQALGRADDPYQRLRLGEMAMRVESGGLWLHGAARHVDDTRYAQMMRAAIEDVGLRVMQLAERCVGARGLLRPEPFERLHRNLTLYLRQPAPDAGMASVGQHVLTRQEPVHRVWGP